MENHLSRRTALLAIGGATAVAAVPIAAIASGPRVDRSVWDQTFAAMLQAKAAMAADDLRHKPIEAAYYAATDAVPHITLGPDPFTGRREPLTTEDHWAVRDARKMVQELADGRRRHDPYTDLMAHEKLYRELAAAADARDAEIERIDQRLGFTPSSERNEAISERYFDLCSDLMEMSAPDSEAMAWKIDYAFGDEADLGREEAYCSSYTMRWITPLVRDSRRLLANGRA